MYLFYFNLFIGYILSVNLKILPNLEVTCNNNNNNLYTQLFLNSASFILKINS